MSLDGLLLVPADHTDYRRMIVDVTPRVKVFRIPPTENIILGNHYHRKMLESLYVIKGALIIKLEDVRTHEKKEYRVHPGDSLTVPVYIAHQILPNAGSIFLNLLTVNYDPEDVDEYIIR